MKSTDPILDAFSKQVARRPTEAMLLSPSSRATFEDVDALSRKVFSATIEPGSLVGLAAPNGPAFIAGFLALRRANVAVLLLDPFAPREDRRRAAGVLGTNAILECSSAWPSVADFRLEIGTAGGDVREFDDIAVVKLTSGSTGVPRGVAMHAESLMADESGLAMTMGFRTDDRIAGAIPMSHSYGFTTLALSAIVRGLTVVLPADQGPFAPLEAARALRATVFPTVPSYIGALLKMSQPPAWPDDIRLVISAGAVLPPATATDFRQTYGQPVHVFYGSSECGGICYDRDGMAAERGTVGTPVEGVRVSLQGGEDVGPAPSPAAGGGGPTGLVTVESAAVGERYAPEPDARLAAGRFETSDLAAWRDGELALLRRIDNVINVRGHKVDPSEVERVLAGLEGVEEVVVLGVASQDHREQIVRAVVACSSRRLDYQDIAAWCRARLADHKVPRSVVIVDAIPRTARGKIDRSALRDMTHG